MPSYFEMFALGATLFSYTNDQKGKGDDAMNSVNWTAGVVVALGDVGVPVAGECSGNLMSGNHHQVGVRFSHRQHIHAEARAHSGSASAFLDSIAFENLQYSLMQDRSYY